ncbi:MAG TPA: hypothetical protein DHW82_11530 [Spirochaetia bacterium]|nr:MAG: hypothetical protein A2Y41_01610 [Spirochaetes bacterium GWB1_36_13]HCL57623.1 hypothetical protein [Spirochaetia bacterium]
MTEALEDYVEAIYILRGKDKTPVRIKNLATYLNLNKTTVVAAVKRLKESNLVNQEHYGYIFLTEDGEKKAFEIYNRHKVLKAFLMEVVKVDEKTAEEEACKMEHILSQETIYKMNLMIKKKPILKETKPS